LLFIFLRFGQPPHLHSFPTRRSSDLPRLQSLERGADGHGGIERFAAAVSVVFRSAQLRLWREVSRDRHAALRWLLQVRREQQVGDRKSTRLNSSHRTISYAVFCLKKK